MIVDEQCNKINCLTLKGILWLLGNNNCVDKDSFIIRFVIDIIDDIGFDAFTSNLIENCYKKSEQGNKILNALKIDKEIFYKKIFNIINNALKHAYMSNKNNSNNDFQYWKTLDLFFIQDIITDIFFEGVYDNSLLETGLQIHNAEEISLIYIKNLQKSKLYDIMLKKLDWDRKTHFTKLKLFIDNMIKNYKYNTKENNNEKCINVRSKSQ